MKDTQLVFVVGSGRCGTKMIKKLLAGVPHIEARHEYVRNAYQRDAMLYYMHKLPYETMAEKLVDIYGSAAHYSEAKVFLDSSHKLSWVVDILANEFPKARFIHLVRDGRKVVSSFYNKLDNFNDYGAKVQQDWLDEKETVMPPMTEEYWQAPPQKRGYDRFPRICWHWVESNYCIFKGLKSVPTERKLFVRLEELASSKPVMENLLDFLDTPYSDTFMETMKRPEHVYVPVDYKLTTEQNIQFREICFGMQNYLGYGKKDEYNVQY